MFRRKKEDKAGGSPEEESIVSPFRKATYNVNLVAQQTPFDWELVGAYLEVLNNQWELAKAEKGKMD